MDFGLTTGFARLDHCVHELVGVQERRVGESVGLEVFAQFVECERPAGGRVG